MFEYHKDKDRYFEMQYLTAREFIIPFILENKKILPKNTVLEIGCAEAGVLKAFLELETFATGIDLNKSRIELAKDYHAASVDEGRVRFLCENIYKLDPNSGDMGFYDIIILKDVIEHIPDQHKFIGHLKKFLRQDGMVFFGFPPWYMPFGGHQQMCRSKWLSKMPWIHLLPSFLYKALLLLGKQQQPVVDELLEIKETGINIERFEKICRDHQLSVVSKRFYFSNPIYKFKFGWEPKILPALFAGLPFFRNFYTTAAYYLIQKN
ncbi:MAG: methyltransferase domain-containing protein [Saprospiraceae bacterium]|nr:methyltransferase domain-containing protein [Saprospiraceae bacterium]